MGTFRAGIESRQEGDSRVTAVMYHYVRDRGGTPDEGIRGLGVESFCRQLDLLCGVMEPIGWAELYAWMRGEAALPARSFVPTFDDGLADHAQVVAPLLEARGMRGAFFVPGRVLEEPVVLPAHQVHLLQARMGEDAFAAAVFGWLRADAQGWSLVEGLDEQAARRIYHYETPARAELKYLLSYVLPTELRARMVNELFSEHVGEQAEAARCWYLDQQQVMDLESAGHAIGGHGYSHEPLERLSADQQDLDLARSASVLRSLLGPGVRPFSYPFGSVDASIAGRVAAAGFAHGFTTQKSWIRWGDDVLLLGRVDTIAVQEWLETEQLCPTS